MTSLDNRYPDEAPEGGYAYCEPTPAPAPAMRLVNHDLAADLGLDSQWLRGTGAAALWTGTQLPPGTRPVALAYAGHQFGQPVAQLGDGRALIIGQLTDRDGRLRDLQLKGSGPTPFSRAGDGRAALGPVLREYIVSEAMHALGIPTSRALTVATTGETIHRQFGPEPGAVLTRVAASHLRFGTFEYFAHRGDTAALQTLTDNAINWHYPDLRSLPPAERPAALLQRVVEQTATLISEWLRVGFIHGVMNTDNMTISGETLDYGPCAFMDGFRPDRVFSSIDARGRYAWNQQPRIGHWNLTRLAECLIPLLDDDEDAAVKRAETILETYPAQFEARYNRVLAAKLGLLDREDEVTTASPEDGELGERFLGLMARHEADFTNSWRALAEGPPDSPAQIDHMSQWLGDTDELRHWMADYANRLERAGVSESRRRLHMDHANPAIIPRNYRIETAIEAARQGDMDPAERLMVALRSPYQLPEASPWLRSPPSADEVVPATFCGT
ncbi:YdiU family protein [Spiribacter vilamensis]|nr:YdiU family protein [Spiribacter vilamensis]